MKWIPLESNIVVMESYAKALGFPTDEATFHDVYGTDPELLAMVPGPHRAVLLLYPTGGKVDAVANHKGDVLEKDDIFWMPQTVRSNIWLAELSTLS
jgi:ubiquitin carboxyl-terminal hydrolase L3